MQNAAPVSALLVRALERCAPRDDTRLSRVVVDLLGPVPVTDQLWVRAHVERPGTKIELLNAQMLAPGPDGAPRPVATAIAWRFQEGDTAELFFTPAAPLRPVSEGRPRSPDDDTNQTYIQSLDWRWLNDIVNDVPGECWVRPIVDLVKGESMTPLQRLFAVADIANGMGSRLSVNEWTVSQHRSHGAHPPGARRRMGRRTSRKPLRPRRSRRLARHALRRTRSGGRPAAGPAGASPLVDTVRFTVANSSP